jgi:LPXTG-motif cell wall-anchored protein
MKLFKTAATVLGMAVLGIAFSSSVRAGEWDRKSILTFSGPVEIPGVHLKGYGVLPAGTYVFKVLDSASDRHIVQIFSKDELTVYATILAIPNLRLKATDKTVITFRERPAGEPEALRAWFYPGRQWGEEFVYPKARAIVLAKETNTPVLFTPVEITPEVTVAIKTPEEPVVVELKRAPVMAIQPSGQEVEIAQVVTPPVIVAQNAPAPTLPATGSSLPLVALFGMLALAGALSLGFIQKRVL